MRLNLELNQELIVSLYHQVVRRYVKDIIKTHNLSMFCVYETHVLFAKVEQFWSSLNYGHVEILEARGYFVGSWIFSRVENLTIIVLNSMHPAISFHIQCKDEVWCFTFI